MMSKKNQISNVSKIIHFCFIVQISTVARGSGEQKHISVHNLKIWCHLKFGPCAKIFAFRRW